MKELYNNILCQLSLVMGAEGAPERNTTINNEISLIYERNSIILSFVKKKRYSKVFGGNLLFVYNLHTNNQSYEEIAVITTVYNIHWLKSL